MTTKLTPLSERSAWKALEAHHEQIHRYDTSASCLRMIRRVVSGYTLEAEGIFLDYSKNRITDETLKLLVQLAEESGLKARIDAMFSGEKINITENRAVLHVASACAEGREDRRRW